MIIWLLLSSAFLSSCSPIVINAMPCVGMVYFQSDLNSRFSLRHPGRVDVTVDWLGRRDNDPSYLLVEGLYGDNLEKPSQATPMLYGGMLQQLRVERGTVPPVHRDQYRGTAFLLPLYILNGDAITPIGHTGFSGSKLDQKMDQLPLTAIQVTPIRTDQVLWGAQEFLHMGSDTIHLSRNRSWQFTLKETDPCARPARFVPFSRFRENVIVY